jgi:hypothetical protein
MEQLEQQLTTIPTNPAVTLQGLLNQITPNKVSETHLKHRDADAEQEIRERETERTGRKKYFDLRDKWSLYLFVLLTIMISFQVVLTFFIGLKLTEFKDHEKFLYMVIGENFLQITGMCVIVVRFLFPQAENNEKNNN